MTLEETFFDYFSELEDPRLDNHNRRHNLYDILVMTVLGVICGADNWVDIVHFAHAKADWLGEFLELPNGIPSHDTFGRVFSLIKPEDFEACFQGWIASLSVDVQNEIIAIDGKTVRGSRGGKQWSKGLHLVSAWAVEHRLTLGQVRTAEKSNEITAVPELLNMLDVQGSIVTIDAMGCQQAIAKQIVGQGADYVLALKENQPSLYQDVVSIFEKGDASLYKKMLHGQRVEKDKGHGRQEKRRYTLISARDNVLFTLRWPGLKGLGRVESTRTVKGETSKEVRYYVTSLSFEATKTFMHAVRQHWQIEVNCHWSLDVSFNEDQNRYRQGDGAQNLALVRKIALNLLKQDPRKIGIATKRKRAGWDHKYLLEVLKSDEHVKEASQKKKSETKARATSPTDTQ